MSLPLILHIITGLKRSGAENVLFRLAKKLTNFRHAVICLSEQEPNDLTDDLKALGIDVFHLGIKPKRPFSLLKCYSIRSLIRSLKPDIIQTWMYHADVIGGLMAKLSCKKPIIWNIRNGTFAPPNRPSKNIPIIVRVAAFLSRFIPHTMLSCAQNAIQFHQSIGYSTVPFIHIPNGIDCDRFTISATKRDDFRKKINVSNTTPCVGLVARWHSQKDIPTFLKACHYIHQNNQNIHFVLVGHNLDNTNNDLCHLVNTYPGLSNKLTLMGSYNDMPTIMNGIDILCVTSAFGEGFPNVIGEAMACGTPCVTTDVGDAAIIVNDNEYICPIEDANRIAISIQKRLTKPIQPNVLRDYIKDHYTLEHMTTMYNTFYQNIS